jgi:hypothetical protein
VIALLSLLILGQVRVVSSFDDGAIVGRVCDDQNANGTCEADEPGLPGVHVLLESGLEALTDAAGRYHLAGVGARAFEISQGGRQLPGRHRIGVDARWLPAGASVVPAAATLEVPMGGLVLQDFAIATRRNDTAGLRLSGAPTLVAGATLHWEATLDGVGDAQRVAVNGVPAVGHLIALELQDGPNEALITVVTEGLLRIFALPLDVVKRRTSALVIPRALQSLGTVTVDAQGMVRSTVDPSVSVSLFTQELIAGTALPTTTSTFTVAVTRGTRRSEEHLDRPQPRGVFALALADGQVSFGKGTPQVAWTGAGLVRARFGAFSLNGELRAEDGDVAALRASPLALLQGRSPDVLERQLDVARVVPTYGDDSATIASNAANARFRVSASLDEVGTIGFGGTRLSFHGSEVGRFERALEGGFLDVATSATNPFGVEVHAAAAPSQVDVVSGQSRAQAHERFEATGGSLFFLRNSPVVQGSEVLRVEWRDSVTGLVVREVTLLRLRDYSIDAVAGRVLLARPLSFLAAESSLQTDPLTASITMNLTVDYEYLTDTAGGAVFGGEVKGRAGPVTVGVGGAVDGAYSLLRGTANATLGPVALSVELARSAGALQGLSYSRDGGLSQTLAPTQATDGFAATARARSVGLFGQGAWDLSARFRDTGFEDLGGVGRLRQVSLRGVQPLGWLSLTVLGDLRDTPDPRDPLSGARVSGRVLGLGVGIERVGWGVRLEARDLLQVRTALDGTDDGGRGGLSVGLAGRYRLTPWLQLRASYRQRVVDYAGNFNDTFASVGADVSPVEWLTVGLRTGWGPQTGLVGWGTLSATRGNETWYGAHSLDVDAPGSGDRRLVTGVRQQLDPSSSVYVEDVSSTDVNGLRLARAVGLTQTIAPGFTLSGRYERGARSTDGVTSDVARDAGGLSLAFERDRVRLFTRGELRIDEGATGVRQWLATAGGEVTLTATLSAMARLQFTHTTNAGLLFARTLDTVAAIAWRPASGAVVLRYTFHRDLHGGFEQVQHVVSLLPTMRFGDRFALGGGGHAAFGSVGNLFSASLRPSVRIIWGLEAAVEGAARTLAPDSGSLTALRAELGYRFDTHFFAGGGYSLFGYSGTGLDAGAPGSNNRGYVRLEAAW